MSDTLTIRLLDRDVALRRDPTWVHLIRYKSDDDSIQVGQFFGGSVDDPPSWEAFVFINEGEFLPQNDHTFTHVRAWADTQELACDRLNVRLIRLREWLR